MAAPRPRRLPTLAGWGLLGGVLVCCGWAYHAGLSGPFLFDDNLSIRLNDHLALTSLTPAALMEAALSGDSGFGRPLSMVTFALNRYAAGLDPEAFKLTNLSIHLLNGLAVFGLTRLILAAWARGREASLPVHHRHFIAVIVSAVWLLHPLNLSSVLYVVQRMNELAALFTLGGLMLYVWGRLRLDEGRRGWPMIIAAAAVCTPLGVMCKENAALLPLFMLVIEASLFGRLAPAAGGRRGLAIFFVLTVAVPALAVLAWLAVSPGDLLQGYRARDFTLGQRLLTEGRVLWHYLAWIVYPRLSSLGLFHDDIPLSRGLFNPLTTAAAGAAHAAMLAAAVLARRRAPLFTLGVLFFYAGHVMESTFLPLEITYEHRNYLPMYGVILPAVFYLYRLALSLGRYGYGIHLAMVAGIVVLGGMTAARAADWSDLQRFADAQVRHHPRSPRANYLAGWLAYTRMMGGPNRRGKDFLAARRFFARATLLDKRYAGGLFGLIILYQSVHRSLDPGVPAMLRHRLRTTPFSNNNGTWLRQLVMCQLRRLCHLPDAQLMGLLKAAETNPTLFGVRKAAVLTVISRYLANARGDYTAALAVARRAARVVPGDLGLRLDVVDLLITMGRRAQARRALDEIERLDTLGAYTSGIDEQKKRLAPD